MFTNEERQKQRTGKYGTPREQYLQELVNEFQQTTEEESKEQIVAHLANFAYDPYNYNFLRKLNVLDLFLDCLTEPNEKLVEFGVGGICNSCADAANAAVIVKNGGILLIISCLSSPVQNTVLSAITSLYYLCTPSTEAVLFFFEIAEILTPQVIEAMRKYEDAQSVNIKFSNLAKAFLGKHVKS
ncbi:uncharacterized protein LOC131049907 isoform X1 [Cryptomeria japonica]|uniref:uncharacterized protein LOC131049907 isoform X1 n=1 Tax=Cryptomeria japonica TaxID=3369 RepID=UPI0027DA7E2C|nr:uncharacterized protein LOC131049907 isoform X1 [Cryptomeria japonica]